MAGLRHVQLSRCTTPEATEPRPPFRAESTARVPSVGVALRKAPNLSSTNSPAASRVRPARQWTLGPVSQYLCPLPGRGPGCHRLPQPRSKPEGGSVPSRTHRPAVCTGGAQAGSGSSSTQEGGSPHPVLRQLELRVLVAPGRCPQGPPGRRWALALGGAVSHPTAFPCLGVPHWVQSSLQWGRGHVSAPG